VLDVPPPGAGLTTVIVAVRGVAKLAEDTVAVNCEELTYVVTNGTPFQFTVEPATKPNPLTVKVYAEPPGTVAAGVIGYNAGTGFGAIVAFVTPGMENNRTARETSRHLGMSNQFIEYSFQILRAGLAITVANTRNGTTMRQYAVARELVTLIS
jgi:hypothetical protein